MKPTIEEISLSMTLKNACDQASLKLIKTRNVPANLGVSSYLALAMRLNRPTLELNIPGNSR